MRQIKRVIIASIWTFGVSGGLWSPLSEAQTRCAPPNMLIVLDNSLSMKRNNKLADANSAIRFVASTFGRSIRFGLLTFCGPRWNRKIQLKLKVGPTNSAQIATLLPTSTCFGTPMKKAMEEVRNYYRSQFLPQDPIKTRDSFVLLVTDGKSTDGDPVLAIQALRALQSGGRVYDIKTYVVGFGSGVDKRDLARMAKAGGSGNYFQANNQQALQQALTKVIQSITKEKCDGKDNDCDGKVDEDFPTKGTSCVGGSGCKGKGIWVCQADGTGLICSAGGGGKPEVCNGLDDDCDGQIDEEWPKKFKPCEAAGDCKNKGKWVCNTNGTGLICTGKIQQKSPEICDGDDNDCNGLVDDGITRPCETACGKGVVRCEKGQWLPCDAPKAQAEICDGIDNNCDGKIDENADKSCKTAACRQGNCVKSCRNGECPGGYQCIKSYCIPPPCHPACGTGLVCIKGRCQRPGCSTPCEAGEICRNNQCVYGPCYQIQCKAREYCKEGKCLALCEEGKCRATEKCVRGRCVADPCSAISCPVGGVCQKGVCVEDLCAATTCNTGNICERGRCVPSPCTEIRCPAGAFCIKDGQCWTKPQEDPGNSRREDPGSSGRQDAGLPPGKSNRGQSNDEASTPLRRRGSGCACIALTPHTQWPSPVSLLVISLLFAFFLRRKNTTTCVEKNK